MRFTAAAVASGVVAVAAAQHNGTWGEGSGSWGPPAGAPSGAWGPPPSESNVWTTEVVTAFTTFCPEATQITHGGSTYSVTSATTLTITNCPGGCTISKPVSSSVVTVCSTCWSSATPSTSVSVPAKPTTTPVVSKPSVGTTAPWKPSNGTAVTTYKPTGTGSWSSSTPSSSTISPYKGDASKASFGVAGLLAAAGLVAAL